MNRLKLLVVFMCGVFLFSGCVTMASSVPGNTVADNRLKADIIRMINMIEKAQAPNCDHKIINTKVVGMEGNTVLEEWIVLSCGKEIVYPVKLIPLQTGGTDFAVTTPKSR